MHPPPSSLAQLRSAVRTYLTWLEHWKVDAIPLASAISSTAADVMKNTSSEQASLFVAPPASKPVHNEKHNKHALAVYPELPDPAPWTGVEGLTRLRDIVGPCTRCKLCEGRNQVVFGQGDANAKLVFVGEGPGAEEDRTGLPFVGAAGDLLNRMIVAMGLQREQTYICNVVKCRPPGNRVPEPDEMFHCGPFLRAQLQIIKPALIVALGKTPTQFLLQNQAPMGKLRGQFASYEGIPVMPTYHPAYLLRNPAAKRQVWEDLQQVMVKLKELS